MKNEKLIAALRDDRLNVEDIHDVMRSAADASGHGSY